MKSCLTSCWSFYKKYKLLVFGLLSAKLLSVIITTIIPKYFGDLIDLLGKGASSDLYRGLFFFAIIYLIEFLIGCFSSYSGVILSSNVANDTSCYYFSHLLDLPVDYHKKYNTGRRFSMLTSDIKGINGYFETLLNTSVTVLSTIGVAVISFRINYKLSLLLLSVLPLTLAINNHFRKKVLKKSKQFARERDAYFGFLKKTVLYLEDLVLQGGTRKMNACFEKNCGRFISEDRQVRLSSIQNRQSLKFLNIVNYLLLTIIGMYFVMSGKLSFGNLIAFSTYSKMLSSNINNIISVNTSLQPAVVAIRRLQELDSDVTTYKTESLLSTKNDVKTITINNLGLSFGKYNIFNDVSLQLEKGKIYGILGENGSGKTSLSRILLGLNKSYTGQVMFDTLDLKDLSREDIGQTLAYVDSKCILYNMSLLDNILLFDDQAQYRADHVFECAQTIGIDVDYLKLNQVIDHKVSDMVELSSGQVQKVMLIRSILRDSSVLVLDEAFNYLDAESKKQFSKYIREIAQDKIVILVSHDLRDYRMCDQVLNIRDKQISETVYEQIG